MQSTSFSLILFPEPTNHLWFEREHTHTKNTTRVHKFIPQCCAHPLEQVARHTAKCRKHCFSGGSWIFFNSLVTYPPHRSSFPSHSCIPLLTVPSPLPLSIMFPQGQWACGCLHAVKLCYSSILRSRRARLDMLTLSETLLAYMSMVRNGENTNYPEKFNIKKWLKTVTLCG